MSKQYPPQQLHVPVLLESIVSLLSPQPQESYLDLTAGYGGHAQAILERTGAYSAAVLVDRDLQAIKALESFHQKGARLLHSDFLTAARQLIDERKQFDVVCVDLGVSSPQLDTVERGFSFQGSANLDMRMDEHQDVTAASIVNTWSEDEIFNLIHTYGEEPKSVSRRYARAIVQQRPIHTTQELADCIIRNHRGRWAKIHPATRTFQALRIATNDELELLQALLPLLPALLKKGGRVGIISFHSLEDRLVKHYFQSENNAGYEAQLELLLKKPISGVDESVFNPRARSAKLRIAVKK